MKNIMATLALMVLLAIPSQAQAYRRHYRDGNGAAVAAGILGLGAGIAAATAGADYDNDYGDAYDSQYVGPGYYYDYHPGYYSDPWYMGIPDGYGWHHW